MLEKAVMQEQHIVEGGLSKFSKLREEIVSKIPP